jgi:hypothetical protein
MTSKYLCTIALSALGALVPRGAAAQSPSPAPDVVVIALESSETSDALLIDRLIKRVTGVDITRTVIDVQGNRPQNDGIRSGIAGGA